MAIKGTRSESIQDSRASGARTGLIELLNNGTVTLESNQNVGLGNLSSQFFGRALEKGGDRTGNRAVNPIPNDRYLAS